MLRKGAALEKETLRRDRIESDTGPLVTLGAIGVWFKRKTSTKLRKVNLLKIQYPAHPRSRRGEWA